MQADPEQPTSGALDSPAADSPGKKSVVGKFKDKAKKLKTKIKKPKSPGAADNNGSSSSSSSEEESGSDQHPQIGDRSGGGGGVVATPGLKGESYDAVPDPKVSEGAAPPTTGVEGKLGDLNLRDAVKPDEHAPPPPVDEGKNAEGRDLLVTSQDPTPMDEDKTAKDHVTEGAAATAAAGAAALGIKSLSESDSGKKEGDVSGEKKSLLEQAKERIFGSSKKIEGEPLETGESKPPPTVTERATGIKDTIAAKLGYGGSNKDLAGAEDPADKSLLQTAQESAADAKGAVASKLDSGDKPVEEKTYTERAYDAATGAKDVVAEKLGYGGAAATAPTAEGDQKSYAQKAQETAVGAKDAVAAKLGYTGEGENVPASTAERFHPGEEDVALSQLITEKMSTGATTVRDTLMRPFGSRSGPPTPTTTPPPSTAQAVAADPAHTTVPGSEGAGGENPGIVGKVTGAVTSLLGTTGSGKKIDEVSSKATEDPHAAAVPKVEETH